MADLGCDFRFFRGIHVKIDIIINISISIGPMLTVFGKQAHLQDLTQMRLINQVLVISLRQDLECLLAIGILAIILGSILIYHDWLLPIKSHDSLIMWSFEITRQTKITISPLSEHLLPPNIARW